MAIQEGFQKRSRKRSSSGSVGFAFSKGSATGGKWAGMGKFGDVDFLKRLLGRAGTNMKNASGQTELLLMAQLADFDAIRLLVNSGVDAKDMLNLSSLHAMALAGDMDAELLLEKKGLFVRKKAEDIDGELAVLRDNFVQASYAAAAKAGNENSPLKKALASANKRIRRMSRALQQQKSVREKRPSLVAKTSAR